jgi:hypothetical protein
MTLVLGVIADDGIVISADGKSTINGVKKPILNEIKVFHIDDGVYFGVASNRVSSDKMRVLALLAKSAMNLTAPYTLRDRIEAFVEYAKELRDDTLKEYPKYRICFTIGGYDRNEKGEATTPFLCALDSWEDFEIIPSRATETGNDGHDIEPAPWTVREAIIRNLRAVKTIQRIDDGIGGRVRSVVITKTEHRIIDNDKLRG